MNATWNEHACKWKEYERTWMHVGIKMKGVHEMKKNGNEHKWKEHERIMKGNYCKMKENAYKWMQHERNMKCCRSTWNQQNNSLIHFRACLGMDFGFMLDLESADFHKTLESDNHKYQLLRCKGFWRELIYNIYPFGSVNCLKRGYATKSHT